MAFFAKTIDKLKGALKKTKQVLNTDVRTLFVPGRQINDEFLIEMEERLIQADMGVGNVEKIIAAIRERWRLGKIRNGGGGAGGDARAAPGELAAGGSGIEICGIGADGDPGGGDQRRGEDNQHRKLAWLLKNQMNKKVMVCASDTFRAAAVEQLTIWADRLGWRLSSTRWAPIRRPWRLTRARRPRRGG